MAKCLVLSSKPRVGVVKPPSGKENGFILISLLRTSAVGAEASHLEVVIVVVTEEGDLLAARNGSGRFRMTENEPKVEEGGMAAEDEGNVVEASNHTRSR